jgi:hypothetical protein
MDINAYLAKVYPDPPCFELVADVYGTELNELATEFKTVNSSVRTYARLFRIALHKRPHGFIQIDTPVDYCVVFMGTNQEIGIHHCGIYYDGKILHAKTEVGVRYDEMHTITDEYGLIEYWAKPNE